MNLAKIRDGSHSWLPVCSGGIAKVEGILSAKEVLGACMGTGIADLRTLLHPALQISVDTTVLELLEAFRESNAKLAVVLDHQGQTAGLVTMADIMLLWPSSVIWRRRTKTTNRISWPAKTVPGWWMARWTLHP
ncbi:MAG: CBS domain-containing protein [Gammaproteobacteria bacterium]